MNNLTPSVAFDVDLSKKDLVNFNFYTAYRNPVVIFFYLTCFGMFIYRFFFTNAEFLKDITTPCVFCFVFIVIIPCAAYLSALNTYRKKNRLHETHHYAIDNEKIHLKGDSFESNFAWSAINKISETKKYFYIWQSRTDANIIPKRDLGSEQIAFLGSVKGRK